MADRLRQLYHRYDWCEYFQLKIEFSGADHYTIERRYFSVCDVGVYIQESSISKAVKSLVTLSTVVLCSLIVIYHAIEVQVCIQTYTFFPQIFSTIVC